MSNPQPGDRVHVTLAMTVDGAGQYQGMDPWTGIGLSPDCPDIVRIEPAPVALPTGFGARIRATVSIDGVIVGTGILLVHAPTEVSPAYPWLSAEQIDGYCRWRSDQLSHVRVVDSGEPT